MFLCMLVAGYGGLVFPFYFFMGVWIFCKLDYYWYLRGEFRGLAWDGWIYLALAGSVLWNSSLSVSYYY